VAAEAVAEEAVAEEAVAEEAVAEEAVAEEAVAAEAVAEEFLEEEIIELTESDIYEEVSETEPDVSVAPVGASVPHDQHDPLSTLTLAELYEKQGYLAKACDIYRTLLTGDPGNPVLRDRIARLAGTEAVQEEIQEEAEESAFDEDFEFPETSEFEEAPVPLAPALLESVPEPADTVEAAEAESSVFEAFEEEQTVVESQLFEAVPELTEVAAAAEPEETVAEAVEEDQVSFESPLVEASPELIADGAAEQFSVFEDVPTPVESAEFAPLAHKTADNVVETLEGWLENIRRIKACR
jgi:hypothetical protein